MALLNWIQAGWNELLIADFAHRSIHTNDVLVLSGNVFIHRSVALGVASSAGQSCLLGPFHPQLGFHLKRNSEKKGKEGVRESGDTCENVQPV